MTPDRSAPVAQSPSQPYRILIVEDERIVALNLEQRLVKLGYKVVGRAASGEEALAKAATGLPDLVLMDIHIEGPIDGIDTAALLHSKQNLRVIYLTAYSEDSTLERARLTQPYGYLIKPFSERELHATLQMALARRVTERALEESEERGRLALESASMGSWEFAPGRSELRTYGLAGELLGDASGAGSMTLADLLTCVHEDDREMVRASVEDAATSGAPCSCEFRQRVAHRPARWIRIVARVFDSEPSSAPRLIGVAQDVSERHLTESRLRQAATVFDETREGLFILDEARRLSTANRAFASITGSDIQTLVGQELPFLQADMLSTAAYSVLWSKVETDGYWQGELNAVRPDGSLFPARLSLNAVRGGPRDGVHLVGILSDFTELRAAQEKLRHLAHYDPLTHLPNRLLMHDRLSLALHRGRRSEKRVAILFLDLDRFKRINDTRGHAVGDQVLCEVGARIQAHVRSHDTVARLGGDEFVIIVENLVDSADVIKLAEKLRTVLAKPMVIGGQSFYTGSSIGIALFPDDGDHADLLLQHADTAMYEAKSAGRNNYAFYNSAMTAKVSHYLIRDHRLYEAFAAGELRLHYQPQFQASTGRLTSVEALIRWQHPELGLLDASEIIPSAEESGLIIELGRWVLREACMQAQRWREAGMRPIRIAVNVSTRQMADGRLCGDVEEVLKQTGLDPASLELEITEASLQTQAISVATLVQLRQRGIGVAIDDFGTGYSCLSSLKHLSLSRLKIDRSFVQDLVDDESSAAITETIIAIATRMRLEVTAEGVETQEQVDLLRRLGCTDLQGWLYSPAVEADRIPAMVEHWDQAA